MDTWHGQPRPLTAGRPSTRPVPGCVEVGDQPGASAGSVEVYFQGFAFPLASRLCVLRVYRWFIVGWRHSGILFGARGFLLVVEGLWVFCHASYQLIKLINPNVIILHLLHY